MGKARNSTDAKQAKKANTVDKFWPVHAPKWQDKLDAGKPLTDEERRRLRECLCAWSNEGYAVAQKWTLKKTITFKRRWKEQLRSWETKEHRGEAFTLEERKEQQVGLGVWWWIGYTDSADWDESAWKQFRAKGGSFANADRLLVEAVNQKRNQGRQSAASRQLWEKIGLDYLDRPLRHRQQGEYNQGAWRRHGENENAAASQKQKECEAWAAARIVGWEQRGLQEEDCDFRSWSNDVPTGAEDGHMGLRLGALYEYVREGRKLRGLLLLLERARKLKPQDQCAARSFEGFTEEQARRELFEMIDVLGFLAEPLAANLPFAEVWRNQRALVEQALKHGRFCFRMRVRHGITSHWKLGRGAPVELAASQELSGATTFETTAWGGGSHKDTDLHSPLPPRRILNGKEVIAVRVDWANYRDAHLKERFGELVKRLRRTNAGSGDVPPEPKAQRGKEKSVSLAGDLTNLRAMRLLHHHANVAQAVIQARRTGNKNASDENLYRDAKAGREEFKRAFPFEGEPYHHKTPGRTARRSV